MFLPSETEDILNEEFSDDVLNHSFSEDKILENIKNLSSKGICNLLVSKGIFNWTHDFKKKCMKELALRNDFDFLTYLKENEIKISITKSGLKDALSVLNF